MELTKEVNFRWGTMRINYENNRIQKLIDNKLKLAKEKGSDFAKKLYKRLDQLKAFQNVNEFMGSGLDNPHILSGNLNNCIGWNIDANKRLIVSLGISPSQPLTPEYVKIEEIIIKGVVDYHGGKENWYIA